MKCLAFLLALFWSGYLKSILATGSVDPESSINFLTIGDWGQRNANQSLVARSIGVQAGRVNASFLVSLGDNFYENGVPTDTDPEWDDVYQSVFNNPSLSIPWYVIAGNHDHANGNGQAEINYYLNKRDNRWTMPAFWFNKVISFGSANSINMEWLFIDTFLLVGDYNSTSGEYSLPSDSSSKQKASDQMEWIESTLQASSADWLFVAGHYPIYSGGEHGNTDFLLTNIKPLLLKYGVDAYFCGHDHNLQHLQSDGGLINYWVSGNGSKRGTYSPIPENLFGMVDPGFSVHSLNATHLSTAFVDRLGKQIYSYVQQRIVKPKH